MLRQHKGLCCDMALRHRHLAHAHSPGASLLQDEERLWTELIDKYDASMAPWRADIVGRAYGNRGNARSRQGKMDAALVDYNRAIQICPWSVDPVLNRCAAVGSLLVQCCCATTSHRCARTAAREKRTSLCHKAVYIGWQRHARPMAQSADSRLLLSQGSLV